MANNYKVHAIDGITSGVDQNVLTDEEYNNDTERVNGSVPNTTIRSALINTSLKESTLFATAFAEFLNSYYSVNTFSINETVANTKSYIEACLDAYLKYGKQMKSVHGSNLIDNTTYDYITIKSYSNEILVKQNEINLRKGNSRMTLNDDVESVNNNVSTTLTKDETRFLKLMPRYQYNFYGLAHARVVSDNTGLLLHIGFQIDYPLSVTVNNEASLKKIMKTNERYLCSGTAQLSGGSFLHPQFIYKDSSNKLHFVFDDLDSIIELDNNFFFEYVDVVDRGEYDYVLPPVFTATYAYEESGVDYYTVSITNPNNGQCTVYYGSGSYTTTTINANSTVSIGVYGSGSGIDAFFLKDTSISIKTLFTV